MRPITWTLVLAASAAVAGGAEAGAWVAVEENPHATPGEVVVNDQSRTYFRVTTQPPVVVPIDGPARLRVITRVELPKGSHEVVTYRLSATEGKKTFETLDTETSAGEAARPASGGAALGKSRRM